MAQAGFAGRPKGGDGLINKRNCLFSFFSKTKAVATKPTKRSI
jgi:hypothetical protein